MRGTVGRILGLIGAAFVPIVSTPTEAQQLDPSHETYGAPIPVARSRARRWRALREVARIDDISLKSLILYDIMNGNWDEFLG